MRRRDFLLASTASAMAASRLAKRARALGSDEGGGRAECCDRTYASVEEAMQSPPETLAYVPAIYAGTGVHRPDYLATIDVDPHSKYYGRVIHRLPMPNVGDELHHFGWNACSSCHGQEGKHRRYLVLPGLASSRIHIVDTLDPRKPEIVKVIEPEEMAQKADLSGPHTVHCLADGTIMISCLGRADGSAPGGFLLLDGNFNVLGRWEQDASGMNFNYDFWYQPRHNVMVSSEWAAPNTVSQGFRLEDVQAGKYGRQIHFWDWQKRRLIQSVDLGEQGQIPLEVRFHHNPSSTHGYVGAALSSSVWHWHHDGQEWQVKRVIEVEPVETDGWPFPVPGLITDIIVSMDDRYLYFSNWLHGDLRQYDISDPAHPKLTGQLWLGGVIGREAPRVRGRRLNGGPQMLQLSLDGRRLYVTNSLYSVWDNQFYPDMASEGSYLLKINCDLEHGGMTLDTDFLVDFGQEPHGPARAHEIRFPGGDTTSDIWS